MDAKGESVVLSLFLISETNKGKTTTMKTKLKSSIIAYHMAVGHRVAAAMVCALCAVGLSAFAEESVTINEVKSVQPWDRAKGTITVDYSLGGVDVATDYKVAFDITANGVTKGVTNAAAKLAEGKQTVFTNDTVSLFCAETRAEDAKVKVSLIAIKPKLGGFQLWEGGPIFAECNVGATKPEDAGYYFWWGDTVGYTHDGEKWVSADGKGTSIKFSNEPPAKTLCVKDAALADYVDANRNLKSDYDAATAHLGAPWRMMTKPEMGVLLTCPHTAINTQGEEFKNNGDTFAGWCIKGKEDYSSKRKIIPQIASSFLRPATAMAPISTRRSANT